MTQEFTTAAPQAATSGLIGGIDAIWLPVVDMARARAFYEGTLGLAPAPRSSEDWALYDLGEGPELVLAGPGASREVVSEGKAAGVGLAFHEFDGMVDTIKTLDLLHMAFETDGCHSGPMSDSEDNNLILHQRKAEPERDRVVDFVVMPVEQMARARAFYEGTLGLSLTSEGRGIWAEYVLPDGSALALFQGEDFTAATGGGVVLGTSDLEQLFATFKRAGKTRSDALVESPKGPLGLVRDSEGNSLVLQRRQPVS